MDRKLERLYEQLGRIDSVIERQTNQRLEKMKEIQQKRDSDKRTWLKDAGPVIDAFLLEAVGENYYYDITPADLTAALRPERLRAIARKEGNAEGKAEGNAAENAGETTGEKTEERSISGKEGGGKPSSSSAKSGTDEPEKQKDEEE